MFIMKKSDGKERESEERECKREREITLSNRSVASVRSMEAKGSRELTTLGMMYCWITAMLTLNPVAEPKY